MKRSSGFIACSPLTTVRAALGYLPDETMPYHAQYLSVCQW